MKLKFYFYYFIFHNTFLMRGHPISMMRKLSPRCSELSEVTQVARDCARLRTPVCRAPVSWAFSVFTCLQGHISRGQNERLGATFSQVFPSVFFFFFPLGREIPFILESWGQTAGLYHAYRRWMRRSLSWGLWSVSIREVTVKTEPAPSLVYKLTFSELSSQLVYLMQKCLVTTVTVFTICLFLWYISKNHSFFHEGLSFPS